MTKHEHSGHRERMKNKLMQIGLENFQEHEMLEILLFFGIPYKNTNIIAHTLIKKFGSISAVLDASIEDLVDIKGMTKNAAILLHMLPSYFREYKKSKTGVNNPIISIDDILPLLEANLQYREMETFFVICLNAQQRIISIVETGVAELSSVLISSRAVVEIALRCKATNLIIAHNHPSGHALPSDSDISLTVELKHMLKSIDVNLVDHLIIAGDTAYSFFLRSEIRESDKCRLKPYSMNKTQPQSSPEYSVLNVRKKADGTFERISSPTN